MNDQFCTLPRRCMNRAVTFALLSVVLAPAALAAVSDKAAVSQVPFAMVVSNDFGVGSFLVEAKDMTWNATDQTFTWTLPAPVTIEDEGTGAPLADMLSASVSVYLAPKAKVAVQYTILARNSTTNISSFGPLLSFLSIGDPQARATFDVNLSDADSSGLAEVTGIGTPGTGMFRAKYNGVGSEGETFAEMIWRVLARSVQPGVGAGDVSASDRVPSWGYIPVGEPVHDVSVEFGLHLSANDVVTVIGTMELNQPVPEDTCPADVDGDGNVSLSDLAELLASFSACAGDSEYQLQADIDRSDCVNLTDLAMLLAQFGTFCP